MVDVAESFDYAVIIFGIALSLWTAIERFAHLEGFMVTVQRDVLFAGYADRLRRSGGEDEVRGSNCDKRE